MKTIGEVKCMKSLSDSADKTIHDLNMTVKDTIQKPDEGTYLFLNYFIFYFIYSFFISNISILLITNILSLYYYLSISFHILLM